MWVVLGSGESEGFLLGGVLGVEWEEEEGGTAGVGRAQGGEGEEGAVELDLWSG